MANGSGKSNNGVSNDGHLARSLNIHWFRQTDLRLHDNPALCRTVELAVGKATKKLPVGAAPTDAPSKTPHSGIVPVFVFDTTRNYGSEVRSKLGCLKCGPRRAKFVLEAVADLRSNLEKRGSGLIVAVGKPEIVISDIAKIAMLQSANVEGGLRVNIVCQEEVCSEELAVDRAVRAELARTTTKGNKFHFETVWGSTLYDPDTLPYDGEVLGIPDTFTPFRNQVEKNCKIGMPLDEPSQAELAMPSNVNAIVSGTACRASLTYMPTLADLGYSPEDIEQASKNVDSRSAMPANYRGGETFALARVKEYIWDKDLLKIYFDTRNGMIGADYSTKFARGSHSAMSRRGILHENVAGMRRLAFKTKARIGSYSKCCGETTANSLPKSTAIVSFTAMESSAQLHTSTRGNGGWIPSKSKHGRMA